MLSFNLDPIFKARGIQKPFSFLINAGFTPHTAHNIINGQLRSFKLEHVELLCLSLNCEPNDLLLFTPNKKSHSAQQSSLMNLSAQEAVVGPQNLLDVPFKELKKMSSEIFNSKQKELE